MNKQLTKIEQQLISEILENTLNSLKIGREITERRKPKIKLDDFLSVDNVILWYKKIESLFQELLDEITTHGTFNCLERFVTEKLNQQSELENLQLENEMVTKQIQEAKSKLEEENLKHQNEIATLNLKLGLLKDQQEDESWQQDVKLKYLRAWLEAQKDQCEKRLEAEKKQLENSIKATETAIENEHLVHDQLENFYSMRLGDYIHQMVYWVDKDEADMNAFKTKIEAKEALYADLQEKISTAQKLYDSREAEMKEYEELKEKRRKEQEHLDFLNGKATKIQAWWKGMMVRCKLGPYKVKKPKGGKKSKKKN